MALLPQHTPTSPGLRVEEVLELGRYPWEGPLRPPGSQTRELVRRAAEQFGIEGLKALSGQGVEDFTYACGTGTGSVAAVLTLQGAVSGRAVAVQMTGGELVVDVERRSSTVEHLFLTGPTNMVAKGELTDEELPL